MTYGLNDEFGARRCSQVEEEANGNSAVDEEIQAVVDVMRA